MSFGTFGEDLAHGGFYFVGKFHTEALLVKKPTIFFENVKIMGLIILENVKIITV